MQQWFSIWQIVFITRHIPPESDLLLDNTIIQCFRIMVQQNSWSQIVQKDICKMLSGGRVNPQENSHLYLCGILAIARACGYSSGSLLFFGFLQNLVLHIPGHVTAPLCSIALFPTYLFRWILGTSRPNQPQKWAVAVYKIHTLLYNLHDSTSVKCC